MNHNAATTATLTKRTDTGLFRQFFRRAPGSHAFTLMELVTVLAIIGILFIIIAPRVQLARRRAIATSCRNNIRQYSLAMNQYMEANNGYFIEAAPDPPGAYVRADGNYIQQSYVGGGVIPVPTPPTGQGQVVLSSGIVDPGSIAPFKIGMPVQRAWIGAFVFPYIYNLTNSYSPVVWWNTTRALPQQLPFYNRAAPAVDAVIQPEQWPTYCPDTIERLGIFTTRRGIGLNTVPNNEFWAVNNPRGFKGFGTDEQGMPDPDMGRFTTYAVNISLVGNHRANMPGNVVGFMDWNFIYGYWASVRNGAGQWGFNNPRIGAVVGMGKAGGRSGCFTDIGFHHPGGKQPAANALLLNGNVITILSNQANSNVYWR